MPNPIQVQLSLGPELEAAKRQYLLTDDEADRVAADAINRSLTTVRSRVSYSLAAKINLPRTYILQLLDLKRASPSNPVGSVTVRRDDGSSRQRHGIPLMEFPGTVQTRAGVLVQVLKDGKVELLRGTFIQVMASGHEGVFERASHLPSEGPNAGAVLKRHGKDGREPGDPKYRLIPGREYRSAGRFSIVERFGPTLPGVLAGSPDVLDAIRVESGDIVSKNVASQVSRRLAERTA